jgi:sulfur-oxidizing protein SoxX
MHKPFRRSIAESLVAALVGGLVVAPAVMADSHGGMSVVEQGKKISENRKKGNCLACHMMGDGQLPGNIGPPLVAMKARFPDKDKLREQIWDATKKNPNSMMPPFGRHRVLTEDEIDKVLEYVYTL